MNPREFPIPKVSSYPIGGTDRHGKLVLGVIAKRRYAVLASGECVQAHEQPLLSFEPIDDPAHPDLIVEDTDLCLDKLLTDVVVRGHAWNHPSRGSFQVEVHVGRYPGRRLIACGERRCTLSATGDILFSSPTVVDRIPISYAMAYGGADLAAEEEIGFPEQETIEWLPAEQRAAATETASPYRYARNPAGRGFLVDATPEAIDALTLPQLEDPDDRLTPERLVIEDPWHWPLQPVPASLDFLGHCLFPRLGWFGHTPDWDPEEIGHRCAEFGEVRLGYAGPSIFDLVEWNLQKRFDRNALQSASLGLRFGPLRGDERLTLVNLHPNLPCWTAQLPHEIPRLAVDDREGGLTPLKPVLQTVLVEPDRSQVTVVWAGFAPARRPYLPEELARMPFLTEW